MALSCARRGSGWILRKISYQKVWSYRNRLPKEVIESLFLQGFKKKVDVALRDMVSGHNLVPG